MYAVDGQEQLVESGHMRSFLEDVAGNFIEDVLADDQPDFLFEGQLKQVSRRPLRRIQGGKEHAGIHEDPAP